MNTLPKSCNYYEKYMKYKKKYIDYKKNLLALRREKSALIGGGIDAQIEILNTYTPTRFVVKYTDAHEKQEKSVIYKAIENAGSGSTGTVYKIEQIEPLLPPGSNMSFAIKLTALEIGFEAENKKEGEVIDSLQVEERVKAIYQGRTGNIDFAIYNYLGENLETFLKKDDITGETKLSLIRQLHDQLYRLNRSNSFHNDVKTENIVVLSTVAPGNLELSLIDYGLYTHGISKMGTYHSMCIHGCTRYFLYTDITSDELTKVDKTEITNFKEEINNLLLKRNIALSTDYVGFFNVIICLLNPNFCAWKIYTDILKIDKKHNDINILNVLCLLCYVSNSPIFRHLLKYQFYKDIVKKIDTNLKTSINPIELFKDFVSAGYIHPHEQMRILFLSYLYVKITSDSMHRYATFVHITKLPKLLWDLSCCLDLNFNLEYFNANFGTIFNDQLLVPLPPPASQPPAPPQQLPQLVDV